MDNSLTVTLNEGNFEEEVTRSAKPVLVDFWAEWCGPCKLIAPLLDEIAKEKGDAVKVAKVDVDQNQASPRATISARSRRCFSLRMANCATRSPA